MVNPLNVYGVGLCLFVLDKALFEQRWPPAHALPKTSDSAFLVLSIAQLSKCPLVKGLQGTARRPAAR
eukprot:1136857-Pelagomonas_calceolata.AAC.1